MPGSLCELHITDRVAADVAAGMIDSVADALGVAAVPRIRLQTLTMEVLGAVIRGAFGDTDDLDIVIEVTRVGDAMHILVRDHGAPLDFGTGYPPRVSELIQLGFADGLQFASDGRAGNRTEIIKNIPYGSIDETFIAETKATPPPAPVVDEDGKADVEIRDMTIEDVTGVARLFYRCYGYTAAYAAAVYQPERMRALVQEGLHLGTVAVATDGTIVGHVAGEVVSADAVIGEIGLFAVDPQFRKFGVGVQMGVYHAAKMYNAGFIGLYTHAVTVHDRSQKAAVRSGGKEVGMMLASQPGELSFQGFDIDGEHRKSTMNFFVNLGRTPQRTVYVPPAYAEVVERIYAHALVPRTVVSHSPGRPEVANQTSEFRVDLRHETGIALLEVAHYGEDFLQTLQAQLQKLRMNRFDLIVVGFPMADPLTAYFASGLHELGLSFAAVMPELNDGDILRLQVLNNVEVLPDTINVASDFGAYLRDFVLADLRRAAETMATRTRSRVHMSRIYEVLDG